MTEHVESHGCVCPLCAARNAAEDLAVAGRRAAMTLREQLRAAADHFCGHGAPESMAGRHGSQPVGRIFFRTALWTVKLFVSTDHGRAQFRAGGWRVQGDVQRDAGRWRMEIDAQRAPQVNGVMGAGDKGHGPAAAAIERADGGTGHG